MRKKYLEQQECL